MAVSLASAGIAENHGFYYGKNHSFRIQFRKKSKPEVTIGRAGQYETRASWWGEYFSPLTITPDGKLSVAGDPINEYEFDAATGTLRFDRHPIKTTEAKAEIKFTEPDWKNLEFSGRIIPRRGDGWVGYSGDLEP